MSEYAEKMQHHIVNMQNMQVIWKNTCSWSAKKTMINKNWQNMQKKMQYRHPPIQEHLVYTQYVCTYM